ncbi:MAG: hydroxyacid dehydrogenase [Candidatus Paceibacterota bacterium]
MTTEKKRVLISDPIHPDAVRRLVEADFDVTELLDNERSTLPGRIGPYHAVICRTSTTLDASTLALAKNLFCIAIASTGYDRIDIEEASRRNIAVLGLPSHNKGIDPERDGNFVSTAEHAVLLILAALGDFYHAHQSMKEGRWDKKYLVGHELAHKTVGFVGFGRIATLVARRLKPFHAKMIAYDGFVSREQAAQEGVELVTLDKLCTQSDVITIHIPKTSETAGMLGEREFSLMKDGVFIINTARAAVMDEKAFIAALKNGKIKRAALDVFHDEPYGLNWDLVRMPNVIATPHIGGSTHEAWRRISLSAVDNIIAFFKGTVQNKINE